MLTVPGNTSRNDKGLSYIVEQAVYHNLPHGLVVNSCCVIPKARRVQVILINTTGQNIWVRQPLPTECRPIAVLTVVCVLLYRY